jgi:hypothetical protein
MRHIQDVRSSGQIHYNADRGRLANIAHVLRYDLEGIVIPLARELVQNKKAILIDPINSRLRTIVMPTSIVDHP